MRRLGTLLLFMFVAPALGAQAPRDSGVTHSRQEWRERVQKQREARMREMLGLTDDQATKLHATLERFATQRKSAFEEMGKLRQALRAQLRPGVAADVDSVRKLLDSEEHNASTLAQLRHDERHEMASYLSPVQLAQLEMMHRRRMGRFHRGGGMRGQMWYRPGPKDGGPGGPPDGGGGDGPEPT
jgi:Spy/CpxP family protein refolding chaperone